MRKGISLLLAMVMVLALVPTTIFTAYAAFSHTVTLNSSGVLEGEIIFDSTSPDVAVTVIAVPSFSYTDSTGLTNGNLAAAIKVKPSDFMAGVGDSASANLQSLCGSFPYLEYNGRSVTDNAGGAKIKISDMTGTVGGPLTTEAVDTAMTGLHVKDGSVPYEFELMVYTGSLEFKSLGKVVLNATPKYTVSLGTMTHGSATIDGGAGPVVVDDGGYVTLTANPAANYHVADWVTDGTGDFYKDAGKSELAEGTETTVYYFPQADSTVSALFVADTPPFLVLDSGSITGTFDSTAAPGDGSTGSNPALNVFGSFRIKNEGDMVAEIATTIFAGDASTNLSTYISLYQNDEATSLIGLRVSPGETVVVKYLVNWVGIEEACSGTMSDSLVLGYTDVDGTNPESLPVPVLITDSNADIAILTADGSITLEDTVGYSDMSKTGTVTVTASGGDVDLASVGLADNALPNAYANAGKSYVEADIISIEYSDGSNSSTIIDGGTATVTVKLRDGLPKGTYPSSVVFLYGMAGTASCSIPVTFMINEATSPVLSANKTALNYTLDDGYTGTDATNAAQQVKFTNVGSGTATISSITVTGTYGANFIVSGVANGATVTAGASVTATVKPDTGMTAAGGGNSDGIYNDAKLVITYDGGAKVEVPLKATIIAQSKPTITSAAATNDSAFILGGEVALGSFSGSDGSTVSSNFLSSGLTKIEWFVGDSSAITGGSAAATGESFVVTAAKFNVGDHVWVRLTADGAAYDNSTTYDFDLGTIATVVVPRYDITVQKTDTSGVAINDTAITVSAAPTAIAAGDTTYLYTNTTDPGYEFVEWVVATNNMGSVTPNDSISATYKMPTDGSAQNVTIQAQYKLVPILKVTKDAATTDGSVWSGTAANTGKGTATNVAAALTDAATSSGDAAKFDAVIKSGGSTISSIAAGASGDVEITVKSGVTLTPGKTYDMVLTVSYADGTDITLPVTYTAPYPTYVITLTHDANGTLSANFGGTSVTTDATNDKTLSVSHGGTVAIEAVPAAGYKFTGWSSTVTADTSGTPAKDAFGDNSRAATSYANVTQAATLSATFAPVTDLSLTPTSGVGTLEEGYTNPSAIYSGTVTNNGAKNASVTYKLYTDSACATADASGNFVLSTATATINAASGSTGGTGTVTVTPKDGLTAGTYKTYLQVTQTENASDTMSGVKTFVVPITLYVTTSSTFTGTVTVRVDNVGKNGTAKVKLGETGTPVTVNASGEASFQNLGVTTSYDVWVAFNGTTFEDTGKIVSNGTKAVTVDYYTLTLAEGTGAKAVSYSPDPSASDATLTQAVLKGTTKPVYAAPDAGYDPASLSWAVADTSASTVANGVVTVKDTVTATASYKPGNGVKYMMNAVDTTTVYVTDSGYYGAAANVTLPAKPSRSGYTFAGWATASTGTAITGSATATALSTADMGSAADGYYTLYALWTKATAVWNVLGSGVYGAEYTGSASITNGAAVGAVTYAHSAGAGQTGLPDGLVFDPDTGAITGQPRETGTFTFTVTATNADSDTWVKNDYEIVVGKATPTVSALSFVGVDEGVAKGNVTVHATVAAPYWNPTGGTGSGAWETVKQYVYGTSAPTLNPGALTVESPATLNFGGNTTLPGTVKFTAATGTNTGLPGQNFSDIYNDVTVPCVFSLAGKTYGIVVDPASKNESVNMGGTYTDTWSFSVENKGNQVAHVTYELDTTSGDHALFTLTEGYDGANCDVIAVGDTTANAFTLAPKIGTGTNEINLSVPGVYTVTVLVKNHETGATGTVQATERVPVRFEVKAVDYAITVETLLHEVGALTGSAAQLPSGTVVLTQTDDPGQTIPVSWDGTGVKYTATGKAGKEYFVTVNGYTVPGMVVSASAPDKSVDLYELKLGTDPADVTFSSGENIAGGGYYLEDQQVLVSAPNAATKGADNYTFQKWVTTDSQLVSSDREFNHVMGAAAVTLTAKYQVNAANTYTVTYEDGVPDQVILVPIDSTSYAAGATVTVSTAVPVRPGYTFKEWKVTAPATGTTITSGSFTMPAQNVTLTAQWELVDASTLWPAAVNGTYGVDYTASVALTDTSATGAVIYTLKSDAGALPGGLKLAADGKITGKPYEVVQNATFTVEATNADGVKWEKAYTISIGKYTPALAVTKAEGAVTGAAYNTATYEVTITAPYLETKGDATNPDVWATRTITAVSLSDGKGGTLATGSGSFAGTGANTVGLTWTPASTGTDTDANGKFFGDVYDNATGSALLYTNGDTFTMQVTPNSHDWHVTKGYETAEKDNDHDGTVVSNKAYGKEFTLENTGNQPTGTLTAAFGKTGLAAVFEFGTTDTLDTTGLAVSGSDTFTVKPKANLDVGIYTDTLTITNAKGVSVTVALVLVVDNAAVFNMDIETVLHTDANRTGAKGDVTSIALRAVGTTTDIAAASHTTSSGEYGWTGLDSSKSYVVVVNGYVSNLVITAATTGPVTVDLYEMRLFQDPADAGATLGLDDGSDIVGYYMAGQPLKAAATVPTDKSLTGWDLKEYSAATGSTDTEGYSTSKNLTYVMPGYPADLTANFADVVEYEVKVSDTDNTVTYFNGGTSETYQDILSGGAVKSGKYMVSDGAVFGLPQPTVGTLASGQYSVSKAGYTFRGWSTDSAATTGAYAFTANAAADGDNDKVITIYPIWTEDSDLAFIGGTVTGIYKHALSGQQVTPATGGSPAGAPANPYTYAWNDTATDGTTYQPYGITMDNAGAFASTAGATPDGVGSMTVKIKVTDDAGDTAVADYVFSISRADMTPDVDHNLPTDAVELKLGTDTTDTAKTAIGNAITDAGTVMDGDGTGETNINGAWTVDSSWTMPDEPGTYDVPVIYTPANGTDDHADDGKNYNPYEGTVKVTVVAKTITGVDMVVTAPKTGETPDSLNTVITAMGTSTTNVTSSDSAAEWQTDLKVTGVRWIPAVATTFEANTKYTVIVDLTIIDGSPYRFDTGLNAFTAQVNTAGAKVDSINANTVSLSYEFPAEAKAIQAIDVTVGTLGEGGTDTDVASAKPSQYTVTAHKWYETSVGSEVTSTNKFDTAKDYDLVVTVKPEEGYQFDSTLFGGVATTPLQKDGVWYATVNGVSSGTAPNPVPKTAKVEVKLTSDGVLQIRYSAFKPVAETPLSISSVEGEAGAYYAMTGADAASHKHYDSNATGNKSGVGFTFDPSGVVVKVNFQKADGTTSVKTVDVADCAFYVGNPDTSSSAVKLVDKTTAAHIFKNFGGETDVADYDEQMVYVKYGTLPATQVGQLRVRELEVMSIDKGTGNEPKLEYKVGDQFDPTTLHTAPAKVSFNTNLAALSNLNVELTDNYAEKDTTDNTPLNYYFATSADGSNELKSTTSLAAGDNGKTVYLCYTDVNDNTVSVAVGTLKVKSEFGVTITDANGGDAEYNDTLTAVPDAGDAGDYTYRWEKWNPAGGDGGAGAWEPIPGATGQTYVPGKGDIDETIRVTATDKTTGTSYGSATNDTDGLTIEARSLNFKVAAKDKVVDGDADNKYTYVAADFTLTNVPASTPNPAYGGIVPGDDVSMAPSATGWNTADNTRPPYIGADVGDTITWPKVTVDTAVTTADKTGGYVLSGTDKKCYRLAEQGTQTNVGTILAKDIINVSHVDVSFQTIPVTGANIPVSPMGVTDLRETQDGDPSGDGDPATFKAYWYEGAFNVDNIGTYTPATGTFGPGKTYTVVVYVKPQTGYAYKYDVSASPAADRTQFNFHFGDDQHVDATNTVKDATGYYIMYHTFTTPTANPAATLAVTTGLGSTLYYAKTTSHAQVATDDNDPIPGGKKNIEFKFSTAGIAGTVTYADGTTKALGTTDDASTTTYTLVVGDSADTATQTIVNEFGFTPSNMAQYDGKKIFVKVGDVVLGTLTSGGDASVGTLKVKELTAESIAATGTLKLSYNAGETFDATGITKATVAFNKDTAGLNVSYDGATRASVAAADGKAYYFELADGTGLTSGTTQLVKNTHDGKLVYICYTDVNGHEVRTPLGTLAVDSNATTAAIQVQNQTHANKDTQYGDVLRAVVTGTTNSGANLEYQWQYLDTTDNNWKNVASNGTGATYTVTKTDVGRFLRVVLTKDGTKDMTNKPVSDSATTMIDADKDSNDHVYADRKAISVAYTWTPGAKTYDGAATVAVNNGAITYSTSDFQAQLVQDVGAAAKDAVTLTSVTAAAFANANVGANKDITLTGGGLNDGAGTAWSNYYDLTVVEPTGTITALQLGWDDFTFIGKVKRYDGNTSVFKTDNFSLTTANAGDTYPNAGVDKDAGLWGVDASKITDATLRAQVEAAITASGVSYVSAASLEPRNGPVTQLSEKANGHSNIKLTFVSNDANIIAPSGVHYIGDSAINPKQVTVDATQCDQPSFSNGTTAVTVEGKVAAADLAIPGDADVTFQVMGQVAAHGPTDTQATVTIIGVTQNSSNGINWANNNYKLVWGTGDEVTGNITGGAPTGADVKSNGKAVYGDSYADVTDLSVEVTFDGGTKQTFTSFAALKNQGIVAIVEHDTNGDSAKEYLFATDTGAKVGWTGTSNTATLNFKLFKAADVSAADSTNYSKTPLGSGTIAVSPRTLTAAAVWNLAKGGNDYTANGKFYDATTAAKSSTLWAKKGATPEDGKGATGSIDFTLGNDAFGDVTNNKVSVKGDYTAAFADANVGSGKTINVSNITLEGTFAGRYTVAGTATATGTIVARPVTVAFDTPSVPVDTTNATASKKTTLTGKLVEEDGSTALPGGEVVPVTTTGTYADVSKAIAAGGTDGVNNVTVTQGTVSNVNYDVTWPAAINGNVVNGTIGAVSLTYKAPAVDKKPADAGYVSPVGYTDQAQVAVTNTAWVETNGWEDFTTSTAIPGNFLAGSAAKYYKVTATVEANTGFVFGATTKFSLNGVLDDSAVTTDHMKVTLSSDKKTATVEYIFQVPAVSTVIQHVNYQLTAPVLGAQRASNATATSTYTNENVLVKPVDSLTGVTSPITWNESSDGTTFGLMTGTEFKSGLFYQAVFTSKNSGSYTFDANVDFTANGSAPAKKGDTITTADGVKVAVTETSGTYTITVTYPKQGSLNIANVYVQTQLPPEHGKTVPSVYINSGEPYAADNTSNLKWEYSATSNMASPTNAVTGDAFLAGKFYRVTGTATLKDQASKDNYDITTATKFYLGGVEIEQGWTTGTDEVTVDGVVYCAKFAADKAPLNDIYPDDTVYTLSLTTKTALEATIVKIAANVTQPIAGVAVPSGTKASLLVAQDKDGVDVTAGVEMGEITWTKKDGSGVFGAIPSEDSGEFVTGGTYKATFTVEAKDGYTLLKDTTANPDDFVDFLINSVFKDANGAWINGADTVNKENVTVTTATADGNVTYTVSVIFANVGNKADVLTVWGNAVPPVAGVTAVSSPIKVADEEPYEIVSGTNKWYSDAGCSTEFTGTFVAGTTYYAKLKVELKSSATAYQFTDTTAGYINDTEAGKTTATPDVGTGTQTNPQSIILVREFTVPKIDTLVYVSSPLPAAGTDVSTVEANIKKAIAGAPYTLSNSKWVNADGSAIADGKFAANTEYHLVTTVTPDTGYALPTVKEGYFWDEGGRLEATSIAAAGSGSYTVTFTYRTPGSSTDLTPIINVKVPVKGESPSNAVSPNNSVTITNTTWTPAGTFAAGNTYTVKVTIDPNKPGGGVYAEGEKIKFNTGEAEIKKDGSGNLYIQDSWTIPNDTISGGNTGGGGGGGGGGSTSEIVVTYWLGETGVTKDLTAETVKKNKYPANVPSVTGISGYKFLGWSETNPSKTSGKPKLVDPTTFKITGDKTFYAVYETEEGHTAVDHSHYVIGYPNGTFGPTDDITRGSVATIIARACLEGFVEGSDYGNPGNYSDVANDWAYSAISFCTINGVFKGYDDGTFRPGQPITRQEFATVIARLAGIQSNQGMPFSDAGDIASWAVDGVYTTYANGWVNGYTDGTFKPLSNIHRDEAVKIFNGYLNRGVDAVGLSELTEYVHSGVASHNTENGSTQYMTWPDVPKGHWAYYEIIEAANDHTFYWPDETKPVPPEHWMNVWIDETWLYHDNANDGGPSA